MIDHQTELITPVLGPVAPDQADLGPGGNGRLPRRAISARPVRWVPARLAKPNLWRKTRNLERNPAEPPA